MSRWSRNGLIAITLALGLAAWPQASALSGGDGGGWGLPSDAAAGHYEYTNRLIDSRDPYLLLHAHNPVDWYPWGREALAAAKQEGKPIFVSIGYSTCYWCHVAEQLIYSNRDIAKLMNTWFVNVKVDREERPDIDRLYMLATEIMTGHGGWPNNLFLTPDLKPFLAGSYFPPQDDPLVGPGFPSILKAVHAAWEGHRADKILPIAERVFESIERVERAESGAAAAPIAASQWLSEAGRALEQRLDPEHGGLGTTGPKFPQAPSLELLLADYRLEHDAAALDALKRTLDAMALGGVHDHLGGGFHRYATEPSWSIPHFEKMLYDNAQLLRLYAEAYHAADDSLYRAVALDIGQYLRREMMAPEGGFFTAQDSQVGGAEGAAYIWRRDQIVSVLGATAAAKFFAVYSLTPLPEADVPTGAPVGNDNNGGVLRVRLPVADTLKRAGASDFAQALSSLVAERRRLLEVRARRPQPARDEKMITGLNGLVIAALARSAAILEQPDFLTWARMAAERLWALAYDPKTGLLRHEVFRGQAQIDGFLADYAMLGDAFMALSEATKEAVWRDRAAALADSLVRRFARSDGALSDSPDEKNLLVPVADREDSEVPAGASVALDLLLRLAESTGEPRYGVAAAGLLGRLSGQIAGRPEIWPSAIVALNAHPLKEPELAVAAAPPPTTAGKASHIPETADHVRAAAALKTAANGEEVVVTLKVDRGYHINANPASFDYLIPTSVVFDHLNPSHIEYPKPTRFKPAFAPEGLDVYEGTVSVVATFPKGCLTLGRDIRGAATAQACNTQICLPPSKLPVSLSATGE
jgi:uncharacterized protein YyaL (SSP411 family)